MSALRSRPGTPSWADLSEEGSDCDDAASVSSLWASDDGAGSARNSRKIFNKKLGRSCLGKGTPGPGEQRITAWGGDPVGSACSSASADLPAAVGSTAPSGASGCSYDAPSRASGCSNDGPQDKAASYSSGGSACSNEGGPTPTGSGATSACSADSSPLPVAAGSAAGPTGSAAGPAPVPFRAFMSAGGSDFETASLSSAPSERNAGKPGVTQEELDALMPKIPLDDNGQLTSIGSMQHEDGSCRPCVFIGSKVGCHVGLLCQFCHLVHRRKAKPRPCKGKRDRHRKLLERVSDMLQTGGGEGDSLPDRAL